MYAKSSSLLKESFPSDLVVSVDHLASTAESKQSHQVIFQSLFELLWFLSSVSKDSIHIKFLQLLEVAFGDIDNKSSHLILSLYIVIKK